MRGIRQIAPSSAIKSVLVPLNSTLNSNLSTVFVSGLLVPDGIAVSAVRAIKSSFTVIGPKSMARFDTIV